MSSLYLLYFLILITETIPTNIYLLSGTVCVILNNFL
nr:MAG TPA: hypothetical protein [Caudoviricetes sp.]